MTTGATEAIAASLLALVDPGDEVVVLEPYYDSYVACIAMAGGRRVPITLRAPDFRLDLDELRAAVTPRTRLLLINSSAQPDRHGAQRRRARAPSPTVAVEHDLIVITDEVYEHITFDGVRHRPLATYDGMRERTLTISSGGKTFSLTGWKIGWAVGPADLVRATMMAKQFLTYTSGRAAAAGDRGGARRWTTTTSATSRPSCRPSATGSRPVSQQLGFEVFVPQGTYFLTTDIRPLGYDDGVEFCLALPERAGVVAIPHSVFYDDKEAGKPLVRWAFCKQDDVIDAALERLATLAALSARCLARALGTSPSTARAAAPAWPTLMLQTAAVIDPGRERREQAHERSARTRSPPSRRAPSPPTCGPRKASSAEGQEKQRPDDEHDRRDRERMSMSVWI